MFRTSYLFSEFLKPLQPLNLLDNMPVPLLIRRHQFLPVPLDVVHVQLRLYVDLADRAEVLPEILEQLSQIVLVPLPRRHLVGAEPRGLRRQFLHLYEGRREGAILHQAVLLSHPGVERRRQFAIFLHSLLRGRVVERVDLGRFGEDLVQGRDVGDEGFFIGLMSVHI